MILVIRLVVLVYPAVQVWFCTKFENSLVHSWDTAFTKHQVAVTFDLQDLISSSLSRRERGSKLSHFNILSALPRK